LAKLPIGSYAVTLKATGFIDQTIEVPVSLAGPTNVNVIMKVDTTGAVGPTLAVTDQLAAGYNAPVSLKVTPTGTSPFPYVWPQTPGIPVTLTGDKTDTVSFTTPDFPTSMGSTATTTAPAITYARFGALGINPDQAGHSVFKVTVTDGNGLSSSATVEV